MKAGLALTACMKNVSDEMIGPLAEEFEKTNAEYALGKDISDCLEAMSERTGSQDVQFFSTAIRIQRETGGNLAEVLDNISHITRERFALRRHVRTLTGEGRLSAIILLALPPVLFLFLLYLRPEYILGFVGTKIGRYCFAGAVGAELFSFLVMRAMMRIKV
ncbi:hypothetical protein FAK_07410 [Desulfoferula mesophila]|uniref:Type II secretion system protein GspF domain-containing protein n=1 Tax=Desulfoferula mesophila TaxID=3058419 RepID=A0AAU9EP31_9BACT|nr:hypothetical protein FAK_07410 [Desulfoferula mesophilus]